MSGIARRHFNAVSIGGAETPGLEPDRDRLGDNDQENEGGAWSPGLVHLISYTYRLCLMANVRDILGKLSITFTNKLRRTTLTRDVIDGGLDSDGIDEHSVG